MNTLRRQTIARYADEMLDGSGVTSLPVDPLELAAGLGIQVVAKPSDQPGASGWLMKQGEQFAIAYATHYSNSGFQRFSVGHELGHFAIDGHPQHLFAASTFHMSKAGLSSDPIELEADYFSACLLMPKRLAGRLISAKRDGLEAVKAMAETCGTSLQAAAIRYAELTDTAMAIVVSRQGAVEYALDRGLRAASGWPSALKRGSKVPAGSATARLLKDPANALACEEDEAWPDLSDWFHGVSKRLTLREEVVGLGRDDAFLTLLTLADGEDDDEEDDREWEPPTFRR